jgi:DNA-binding XRE family transcriptional regulator
LKSSWRDFIRTKNGLQANISRNAITMLENQLRRVPDLELFLLARVLGARIEELFPRQIRTAQVRALFPAYRAKLSRGQVPPDRP